MAAHGIAHFDAPLSSIQFDSLLIRVDQLQQAGVSPRRSAYHIATDAEGDLQAQPKNER